MISLKLSQFTVSLNDQSCASVIEDSSGHKSFASAAVSFATVCTGNSIMNSQEALWNEGQLTLYFSSGAPLILDVSEKGESGCH